MIVFLLACSSMVPLVPPYSSGRTSVPRSSTSRCRCPLVWTKTLLLSFSFMSPLTMTKVFSITTGMFTRCTTCGIEGNTWIKKGVMCAYANTGEVHSVITWKRVLIFFAQPGVNCLTWAMPIPE